MLNRKFLILLHAITVAITNFTQDVVAVSEPVLQKPSVDWLIVGAGPAGIITIGVLMDIGVNPNNIAWLDPVFEVGRMGQYYSSVESNNKAKEFVAFINACATFQECSCPAIDALKQLDPQQPCILESIVEPLSCLSAYLRSKVLSVQDSMIEIGFYEELWQVATQQHGVIAAQHVVLATGSSPRTLNLNTHPTVIPLDYALDPVTLKTLVTADDLLGIIGGAHSAILLLKYLSTMNVKHVYNFYRHPITYAIGQGCWAIDQLGVKGTTGEWAQQVLEKNPPSHITRIQFDEVEQLPGLLGHNKCNKLVYAIGYEPNALPAINGIIPINNYNGQTGVIAPRLFGIGIAFPEQKIDDGHPRYSIGLNCFMDYAQRLIPQWVNDDIDPLRSRKRAQEQKKALARVADLLTITVL